MPRVQAQHRWRLLPPGPHPALAPSSTSPAERQELVLAQGPTTAMIDLDAGRVEYRLDRRGPAWVLLCHGGHMRAGLALGEELFAELGYSVLVPSRPGYGRTPLRTGRSPAGFADAAAELCQRLGIERLVAVVGVSAGGPTAVTMAARHPRLVERLLLLGAVGFGPYPDRRTRLGAYMVFNPVIEPMTWAGIRALLRLAPGVGLQLLLRGTSKVPVRELLAGLSDQHRATLVRLFAGMRSGRGSSTTCAALRM
jgi:pimeloyl-ACP methyl ester carboxylesterase